MGNYVNMASCTVTYFNGNTVTDVRRRSGQPGWRNSGTGSYNTDVLSNYYSEDTVGIDIGTLALGDVVNCTMYNSPKNIMAGEQVRQRRRAALHGG